eukprot:TRINITY_DN7004_c0_g1_i1.p1 TRINITY_DN7004_c0_g1~~TRINITY_DN7004_c0_g1_i1.p1  ORF type:complete len:365 (-),score=87.82 TRINITY_DN7004_c0_g1_i1:68-1162(-)
MEKDDQDVSRHVSYGKMAENCADWVLPPQSKKVKWVVTEKIHGANFAFISNGETLTMAKRKAFLKKGESFFGHTSLMEEYEAKTHKLYRHLKNRYATLKEVTLFGELFGGSYPADEVPVLPGVQAVQTGVYYSNAIAFCAFDIRLTLSSPSSISYAGFEEFDQACKELDIFHVQPLHVGTLVSCLEYDVNFITHLPVLLGFPPLPDNWAEGVVIKPMKEILVKTKKGEGRAIVKNKAALFQEDSRYQNAQKWDKTYFDDGSATTEATQTFLVSEALYLTNANRLQNAISKVGQVELGEKAKVRELYSLFVDDVISQLESDNEDLLEEVREGDIMEVMKNVRENVEAEAEVVMKKHFRKRERRKK